MILGPPEEDGTAPTTAAYDSPKALVLAAILREAEGSGVLLDDMVVVVSVERGGLVALVVGDSCFGVVWWLVVIVVVRERVLVDSIEAAVRCLPENAQWLIAA